MYDLRVYSMAAIRTYEGGKLVEDMADDYLTTCQSTAVPTPVSLNLVKSPAELTAAVEANQAITYAQARSLDQVWDDALHWNGSYDGLNVFLSDGPVILAWPKCLRVMTFRRGELRLRAVDVALAGTRHLRGGAEGDPHLRRAEPVPALRTAKGPRTST